ncbi:hypothetical protein CP970_02370 [Streptomyces kanamyceticus]|uniref:Uncharacterized protein n=1 Tax=Streptomyces kanamyceticus TaxID=1967 RepID=A0A5J6G2V1_STRKN|nr:hypothetical protein CP970_02370 [Streptomyces kanamyceticus]
MDRPAGRPRLGVHHPATRRTAPQNLTTATRPAPSAPGSAIPSCLGVPHDHGQPAGKRAAQDDPQTRITSSRGLYDVAVEFSRWRSPGLGCASPSSSRTCG